MFQRSLMILAIPIVVAACGQQNRPLLSASKLESGPARTDYRGNSIEDLRKGFPGLIDAADQVVVAQLATADTRAFGVDGMHNAVAFYGDSVGGWKRPDGVTIPIVNDADIVVNYDKYASGEIECTPTTYTTKYDLTRTLAHEFGHVVGLNHNAQTACATYRYGQRIAFGSLCTPEKEAAKTLYGVKP